jgi:hypothetical protein
MLVLFLLLFSRQSSSFIETVSSLFMGGGSNVLSFQRFLCEDLGLFGQWFKS